MRIPNPFKRQPKTQYPNITIAMAMAVSEGAEYLLDHGDPYSLGTDLRKLEDELVRCIRANHVNVFTGKART